MTDKSSKRSNDSNQKDTQNVQRLESNLNSPSTPSNLNEERIQLIKEKNKLISANKFSGNTKEVREYKNKISGLSQLQLCWTIGLLLSDASLQANNNNTSCRLKIQQADFNKELLDQTFNVLEEFCSGISGPSTRQVGTIYYDLTTISHPAFNELKSFFESSSFPLQPRQVLKKVINNSIEPFLTPLCIAVWFCGDGGKRDYGKNQGKAIQFHTHGFDLKSVEILRDALHNIYEWDVSVKLDYSRDGKDFYLLQIEASSFNSFVSQIEPLILPTFKKRLPKPRSKRSRYLS
jgi:hypothetical protein